MGQTDLLVDTDAESDDAPARFTTRRLVRWGMVLFVGILAVLAIWQDPLYATHP